MERSIYIYGHSDKSHEGIPDAEYMEKFIRDEVFRVFKRRFHHTQGKKADVIVLSQDGIMYGHFEIIEKVPVTAEDRKAYSKVKHVYIVRRSALYAKPVRLSTIGSPRIQFGFRITESTLKNIESLATQVAYFDGDDLQKTDS